MNKQQKQVLQSQLDDEKKILNELEEHYRSALAEIEDKIKILSADEQTQSRIYRIEHQKALQKQMSDILDTLHNNEFKSIDEYLNACYDSGFSGVMYDLQGQGIPLILPIDQKAAVKAITMDSKIKEGLYKSLGKDIKSLQQTIASEVARGISSGSSYSVISKNLSFMAGIPERRAMTIARTEGHRIQIQSAIDAQHEAKKKGADIVKQWDASLDGVTRESHRKLDGQIVDIDEDFEVDGMTASAPGMFGDPAEDCNCRCSLLQRARWALGKSELEEQKERAAFFGLDKSRSFEDFKAKYMKAEVD